MSQIGNTVHAKADETPSVAPDAISSSTADLADVIVITGMSGAGRTEDMHTFEDLGYYVIDNLPPRLIVTLTEMVSISTGIGRHLAIVCNLRSQGLFDELLDVIEELQLMK